jgi:hypothetical protein
LNIKIPLATIKHFLASLATGIIRHPLLSSKMSSGNLGSNAADLPPPPEMKGTLDPGPVVWDHDRFSWDIRGLPNPYRIGTSIFSVVVNLLDGTRPAEGFENDGGGWTIQLERRESDGSWIEMYTKRMKAYYRKTVPMEITPDVFPDEVGTYRLGFFRNQSFFFLGLDETINLGSRSAPFTAELPQKPAK